MCCAAQPPQRPYQRQIGSARSGAALSVSIRSARLPAEPDPRALAGQRIGHDRAVRRDAIAMRVERDDRKLFDRLSHGARRSGIPALRRRRGLAMGSGRELAQPSASTHARTAAHARSSAASLLTRPLTMSARPTSNCGLTRLTSHAALRGEPQHMRQHEPLRDEAHVDDDCVRRLGETLGVKRARIDALERAHARVGGEARIELAAADVDRDHLRRAARKQDVGEAAGRGADVEADEARGIEREGVERGGELDPAARGPGVGRLGLDRARRRPRPRTPSSSATPPTVTRPAAIAACARARLGKKPRSTRRMSARFPSWAERYRIAP